MIRIHRFFDWLFSDKMNALLMQSKADEILIQNLKDACRKKEEDDDAIIQNLKEEGRQKAKDIDSLLMENSSFVDRRVTLEDFILKPNQLISLKSCSSEYRQALRDAGEHICLTEPSECCRKTAVKYRNYHMKLTLHPTKNNEIPSDRTVADEINDRNKKLFAPKNV